MSNVSHWIWLVGGVLLCAAELLAPGVFLLWIGFAAITVGLVQFLAPLSLEWSLIAFGALAIVYALIGRRVYGGLETTSGDVLHRRTEALIGRELTLVDPIVDGEGRAKVQDSVWRVRGPAAPAGARVRVVGIEPGGAVLRVETV